MLNTTRGLSESASTRRSAPSERQSPSFTFINSTSGGMKKSPDIRNVSSSGTKIMKGPSSTEKQEWRDEGFGSGERV